MKKTIVGGFLAFGSSRQEKRYRRSAMALFVSSLLFFPLMAERVASAYDDLMRQEAREPMSRGLAAARQQEWETAVKYFEQAREAAGDSPTALFNLAMAYDRAGKYDMPAISTYRAFLASASTMPELAQQGQKVKERVTELEVRVEAHIRKLIERAKAMIASGHPSSHQDLHNLAVTLFGKEAADKEDDDVWRGDLYENVAEAQARLGDTSGAKATAAGIEGKSNARQNSAYTKIAAVQAELGDFFDAKATAERIAEASYRDQAYGHIWRSQIEAGDLAGAKETAARIGKGSVWSMYWQLAIAQAKARDVAGAKESLARMDQKSDKSGAYVEIVRAQAKAGDFAGAKEVLSAITRDDYRMQAYWALAEGQVKANDFAGALASTAQFLNKDDKAAMYRAIIGGQTKTKDFRGAQETATAIAVPYEKAMTYREIAEAQAAGRGQGGRTQGIRGGKSGRSRSRPRQG